MSVYIDSERNPFGCMLMCHMVADTLEELHDMADRLKLRREWFQGGDRFPHYDVCQSKRIEAIRLGALPIDRQELRDFMLRRKV